MNNGGIGIAVEAPGFDYPMPIAQSRATAMQAALSRWFPAEEGILDRINESRPSVRARDFFIDDRNAVDKERIREKLMAMRKAFWITLIGMVFGCFIAVPGLYALTQFAYLFHGRVVLDDVAELLVEGIGNPVVASFALEHRGLHIERLFKEHSFPEAFIQDSA